MSMKKQVVFLSVCLLGFFLISAPVLAQEAANDTSFYRKSLSSARLQYMINIGANSYLYNGGAYEHYWNRVIGHPFFMTDQFQQGTLYYDGTFYENVPLMYDMFRDELVSKNFSKTIDQKILSEKIRYFTIGNSSFVRIVADSVNGASLPTGFYEKLYDGTVTVLEKHEKKIERSLKAEENTSKFTEYVHFYIEKDGKYYSVETEGDLQGVFKDEKTEVRKFLNRKDIRFKKDKANTIVQVASFYDGLKK
jgi:hypothetical protein